ncbi:phenolic glucoside malonyltransferase 1-like [Carica papaya]|uniref:phenolic glucoside malonyltransferase 1-like n=1 Tax=Carica papaya TaxID=3649 RepID=UPI000B8CC6BD|nr:phenolic glucoside malonyltransferase 1-like [Carica papaya]
MKKVEVSRVAPPSDSQNSVSQISLPLTFFDTFWLKFPPTQRLFFYQLNLTFSQPSYFYSFILPRLKRSLSFALHRYLPLAGNIEWDPDYPKPVIFYSTNDAVSLTVAESTADFGYLSGNETHRKAIELHALVPELSVNDHVSSIISLQITLFPSQGFCIGVTTHHAVLDGQTIASFVKSWAHICKAQDQENVSLPPELIPCFSRSSIKDPGRVDVALLNQWIALSGRDHDHSDHRNSRNLKLLPVREVDPEFIRVKLELTREDLKKIRERVLRNEVIIKHYEQDQSPLHLSTFVLTYAYMLTCMVKAKGGDNSNREIIIGFAADYRNRLDPPLPLNYFGNCIGAEMDFSIARVFMGQNGIAIAAKIVSDMVSRLGARSLHKLPDVLSDFMTKVSNTNVQTFSVAGSTRFGVYGTDFGWGKPKSVEIVSIDGNGAFSMAESRDGSGGVEIGLSSTRDYIERLTGLFTEGLNSDL